MASVGRYELVRVLGRGGSGEVWEAALVGPGGLRRRVALKIRHGGGSQLRQEARIGGLLRHRHLVDVYEVGEHEGRWFSAMELCDSGPLSRHLPLPPSAVVEIGLQVCEALAYAHDELGLVHLDLKPDNLLVHQGIVKVADLGISRARGFHDDGRVRGTSGYMAPEQVRGGAVDARTDLWALGITLAELATGARGSGSVTWVEPEIAAVDDVPWPDDLPAALEPIVGRCLAHAPEDRWPSMKALAAALRAVRVEGPSLAELVPPPPVQAASEPRERLLVGRAAELGALAEALRAPGGVVVTGPPGIGKSALAKQATGADRIWCALDEVRSASDLRVAIADAMGIRLTDGDQQLGWALQARGEAILVLDRFEHLVSLAPEVEALARAAPRARLVVTSRLPLDLDWARLDLGPLADDDATALIVAVAAERGVEVARGAPLRELAARLDGVPLALELAAGRLGVLSLAEVLDKLDPRFLRSGAGGRLGSVDAAVAWSWDLLTPAQQRALAQLSVFAGGFTVERAEEVLDVPEVLDRLDELVRHSLVAPAPDGRLRLLGTIRAFAASRLDDPEPVFARHGAAFAALVRRGMAPAEAIRELDNLNVALERALERGDLPVASAVLDALHEALLRRGPLERLVALNEALLARRLEPAEAVKRHVRVCRVEIAIGRVESAAAHATAAAALAEALGDPRWLAEAALTRGVIEQRSRRLESARRAYLEALALAERAGERRIEGRARGNLATLAILEGGSDALALSEAALEVQREVGDAEAIGNTLANLGVLHRRAGRPQEAVAAYRDAMAVYRSVGIDGRAVPAHENLVLSLFDLGRLDEGDRLVRELIEERARLGARAELTQALILSSYLSSGLDRPDEARQALERARAIARSIGDVDLELRATLQLGTTLASAGRWREAAGALDEPMGGPLDAAQRAELELARARIAFDRGQVARARAQVERAAALRDSWPVLAMRLDLAWTDGALERVAALARAGLDLSRGSPMDRCRACGVAAMVALRQGRLEDVERLALEALSLTHRPTWRVFPSIALSALDFRAGRVDVGEQRLVALYERFWPRRCWEAGVLRGELARARALCGDAEAAKALYEEAEALMRELAPVGSLVEFLVERAERLADSGDVAGARAKLDEAAAVPFEGRALAAQIAALRVRVGPQG